MLGRSGQKRALAKARLHLAQVFFLTRRYSESLEQTDEVAQLCGEMGHHRFLAADGRRLYLLLQYAASRGKNKDFFAQLAEQIGGEVASEPVVEAIQKPPAMHPVAVTPRLRVHVLGPPRISLDETLIFSTAWGSSKAREMLLLMLHKRQALQKEKIVEWLWPEISSAKANSNFHSTLYRMRSALYPNCVERDGGLYQLNPEWDYWLDSREFERLLDDAERLPEDDPQLETLLTSAVELYRGPFLVDTDAEWAAEARTELEFKFMRSAAALSLRLESRGDLQQSISPLERVLAIDELQEDLYYKVIELYLGLGDVASATRIRQRCLSIFDESSSLSDSPRIRKLLARLN